MYDNAWVWQLNVKRQQQNGDDDGRFLFKFEFRDTKNFNVNFNCQFYLHLSALEILKSLNRVLKLHGGSNMQIKSFHDGRHFQR